MGKNFSGKPVRIPVSQHASLHVGLDYDTNPERSFPLLTMREHVKRQDHMHVRLTEAGAKKLVDYLQTWLWGIGK